MTSDITSSVFESERFRATLFGIRINALFGEFPMLQSSVEPIDIDWNYALLCASGLSLAPSERSQKATLRVATACLSDQAGTSGEQRRGAAALLERVGNQRSVELAESRALVEHDAWLDLPASLRLESIRAKLDFSIQLSSGASLSVNAFQRELWAGVESAGWLSVSAPTSVGKSRIVREWMLEYARSNSIATLVYVAPTRALVEEVSSDFRREAPAATAVISMPWDPALSASSSRIIVVTQERLHLIQEAMRPFVADIVFVDEAQGLAGSERGILLQQVIDRALTDSPSLQLIFASPLTSNPGLLLEGAPQNVTTLPVASEAVTVNQNLLRVESVRRAPSRRVVSLIDNGQAFEVASFDLGRRATTVPMRLAYVAHALGGNGGGNIVYVNSANDAEKVANNLVGLLPSAKDDADIANLQQLVRSVVHPNYSLATVLGRRVGFHYGNMPLAIRAEIERLFSEGVLEYLVCTSTLLEGVNLPCRSIFMRNPQKGHGRPLSEADFWNLAGRAGRWGKEFQGNIICIDTDDPELWPNLPVIRKRSTISLATRTGLTDPSPLLAYIRSGFAVDAATAESENLYSYLCARYAAGVSNDLHLALVESQDQRAEIFRAIVFGVETSGVPAELVARHAGISPVSMGRLLHEFRNSGMDASDLVLPFPEESDARESYQRALVRIGASMTTAFGPGARGGGVDKRKWQLANLIVNWMKGMPLARLIDQRLNSNVALPKAIRDVMADVETIARFQAPKFLACYSEVLAVYAAEQGLTDFGVGRPDITMLLELGVSRPSEVALMLLGLSRSATVALAGYVTVDAWTQEEAIEWLRDLSLEGLDLPVLTQREILTLLTASSSDSA